jgi:hypothetical protein
MQEGLTNGFHYYNKNGGGRITQEFLKEVLKDSKDTQFLILEGWFNIGAQRMSLMDILNQMYEAGYDFVRFLQQDSRNVQGEMLFRKTDTKKIENKKSDNRKSAE